MVANFDSHTRLYGAEKSRRGPAESVPVTPGALSQRPPVFHWKNINSIYCAAKIPPVCIDSEINPGFTPFGMYCDDFVNRTPQDTPVYVPVGSADLYRHAWGWNYFSNFIETDDFPDSGIGYVAIDGNEEESNYYDLFGRKVETPIPGNIYVRNRKKYIIR